MTKISPWQPEQSPVLLVDPRAIRYIEPAHPNDAPGSKIFLWPGDPTDLHFVRETPEEVMELIGRVQP